MVAFTELWQIRGRELFCINCCPDDWSCVIYYAE